MISEVVFMGERGNFDEKRWKLGICLVVRRDNSEFHPLCCYYDHHYINTEYFAEKLNPSITL